MKQKLLLCLAVSLACMMPKAQNVPVADLLDVQFNADGTAEDLSPMENDVVYVGSGTDFSYNTYFERVVPFFNNEWSKTGTGYFRVDFENNQQFRDALADGHSLEILVKANYEGTIQNVEAKPFSAMQTGGTGFLVTTISGERQNELCFLPNVTTSGGSTWRWATSGVVPRSGIYYHVIGVWNKEEGKAYIYVDGVLCNTVDAPGEFHFATDGSNWFCVGGDSAGSSAGQCWNGEVVIARVYDKALDGDEALALWNAVADQERTANAAAYLDIVDEGRLYLQDVVATQSLLDEYEDAINTLEELARGGVYDELDAQAQTVKTLRTQVEASATAYARYVGRVEYAVTYLRENDDFEGDDRDYITSYLEDYIEPNGDVRDVCCGTNIGNSREYYDKRRRITGDLHGQAPLIWCCAALAEYVRKVSP